MNAADRLRHGIENIERAVNEMHAENVAAESLEEIDSLIHELKHESDELPGKIYGFEDTACNDCAHGVLIHERLPYGEGFVDRSLTECQAKTQYDCPVVKACGFVDESDIANTVPRAFRRQAE